MVKRDTKKKEESEDISDDSDVAPQQDVFDNSSESEDESDAPKKETKKPEKSPDEEDDTDDEQSDKAPTGQTDTSMLKKNVSEYVKLDNLIREKKEEIKELNEKKQEYEEYIMQYLEKENKTKIETNDGDIVYNKQSKKAPLKEDLFEKAIVKKFQDSKKITESGVKIAHDIIEEVNALRAVSVKNNIKRVRKQPPKKK